MSKEKSLNLSDEVKEILFKHVEMIDEMFRKTDAGIIFLNGLSKQAPDKFKRNYNKKSDVPTKQD